jgi:hypothetical protein
LSKAIGNLITQRRGGAKKKGKSFSLRLCAAARESFSVPNCREALTLRFVSILSAAVMLAACGSNLPKTIPVSGQVTFDGQPSPAAGSVLFLPIEAAEGFPSRPASGAFGTDGRFKAKTFEPGDGLMPGKYLLSVECWETPPSMQGNPGKSHVPKKYQSPQTSGLKLYVTRDMGPQEIKVDVVTK